MLVYESISSETDNKGSNPRNILFGYPREYQSESNGQKKERLIESYYQTTYYHG